MSGAGTPWISQLKTTASPTTAELLRGALENGRRTTREERHIRWRNWSEVHWRTVGELQEKNVSSDGGTGLRYTGERTENYKRRTSHQMEELV